MSFFQSLVGMIWIAAIGLSFVGALAAVDTYETLKRIEQSVQRIEARRKGRKK